MAVTLGLLNRHGWVTDPSVIIRMAFAHIYETDKSQSELFEGGITSVSELVEKGGDDLHDIATSLEEGLGLYFKRYNSNTRVTVGEIEGNGSKGTLQIELKYQDQEGVYRDLSWAIAIRNNKVNIIDIVNGGYTA